MTRPRRTGRGRRPGLPRTHDEILAAALAEFGEHGYDAATVRAIAARAGVDAAMVHHFFGSKEQLFRVALDVPVDPDALFADIVDGEPDRLGERAVRTFLRAWENPAFRRPMLSLLRSATAQPAVAGLLREFVVAVLFRRISPVFGGVPDAELRMQTAASHLVGMAVMRFVMHVEPIASATEEELVVLIGPGIQRYIP
ncbi:TetR family transcriptional regulator [Phytoactinopolyspora endophytica]|uniref:TetR/AcrR family transcriptional regulator n=1 Tax=Phytoactinopolyspora endophytica TaxID=1642495 RepID=UPI00101C2912|nr:TetR family transcriptional regulator [Phytoactinopolyspora endophytica]